MNIDPRYLESVRLEYGVECAAFFVALSEADGAQTPQEFADLTEEAIQEIYGDQIPTPAIVWQFKTCSP